MRYGLPLTDLMRRLFLTIFRAGAPPQVASTLYSEGTVKGGPGARELSACQSVSQFEFINLVHIDAFGQVRSARELITYALRPLSGAQKRGRSLAIFRYHSVVHPA